MTAVHAQEEGLQVNHKRPFSVRLTLTMDSIVPNAKLLRVGVNAVGSAVFEVGWWEGGEKFARGMFQRKYFAAETQMNFSKNISESSTAT